MASLVLLLGSRVLAQAFALEARVQPLVLLFIIVVLGVPMILGFWRIFAYVLLHDQLVHRRARWRDWIGRTGPMVALLLLLAIPNLSFWQDPFNYQVAIGSWTLIDLAYALDGFIVLALVAFLCLVLTRNADRQASRLDLLAMRKLGIFSAILLFFSIGNNWLSAVCIFFLGWLLADKLLLPLSQARLLPAVTRMESERARRLRRLLELRRLERALSTLEREYLPKVGKGEISFEDFKKRQRPLETRIQQLRPAGSKVDTDIRALSPALVLAARPVRSDWDNAVRCARLSLLFAAPWLALYVWQVLTGPSLEANFASLRLLQGLSLVVIRWLALGFFFGYFYRYIRGLNGLQKGTWLFVTIVAPSVLTNALLYQYGADWPTTVQWALQIFVVTMLLGVVAGDYESFRSARLGWRHLVEVHNGRALVTWGSSVIIAIGVSISTLIVNGFTQVLNAYLVSAGYLGPGGTRPGH
jgi:hypothetical protein